MATKPRKSGAKRPKSKPTRRAVAKQRPPRRVRRAPKPADVRPSSGGVHVEAPAAVANRVPETFLKQVATTAGGVIVAGVEALDPVFIPSPTAAGPQSVATYELNPLQSFFSRLSSMASIYEKFKWKLLEVHYRANCGTDTDGSFLGYIDYDPVDIPASTTKSILNQRTRCYGTVWESNCLRYQPQGQSLKWYFCSSDVDNADAEARQNFPGVVRLFISDPTNTEIGKAVGQLFVRYVCEFTDLKPSTPVGLGAAVPNQSNTGDALHITTSGAPQSLRTANQHPLDSSSTSGQLKKWAIELVANTRYMVHMRFSGAIVTNATGVKLKRVVVGAQISSAVTVFTQALSGTPTTVYPSTIFVPIENEWLYLEFDGGTGTRSIAATVIDLSVVATSNQTVGLRALKGPSPRITFRGYDLPAQLDAAIAALYIAGARNVTIEYDDVASKDEVAKKPPLERLNNELARPDKSFLDPELIAAIRREVLSTVSDEKWFAAEAPSR
jgi:hypothetical protein